MTKLIYTLLLTTSRAENLWWCGGGVVVGVSNNLKWNFFLLCL